MIAILFMNIMHESIQNLTKNNSKAVTVDMNTDNINVR